MESHNIIQKQIRNQVVGELTIEVHFRCEDIKESVILCMQNDECYIRPLFCLFKKIPANLCDELLASCEFEPENWQGEEYEMETNMTFDAFCGKYYNNLEK